jgi:hypothetical protein
VLSRVAGLEDGGRLKKEIRVRAHANYSYRAYLGEQRRNGDKLGLFLFDAMLELGLVWETGSNCSWSTSFILRWRRMEPVVK